MKACGNGEVAAPWCLNRHRKRTAAPPRNKETLARMPAYLIGSLIASSTVARNESQPYVLVIS